MPNVDHTGVEIHLTPAKGECFSFAKPNGYRCRDEGLARNALVLLPAGVTAAVMQRAVATAVKPLEEEIEVRTKREQLRRRADEVAARAEALLLAALDEHYEYIS